jgi:ketosteroid isomerase-like protein
MNQDSISVVKKCFQAYVQKDRALIESVIADDFHFTSPLDNKIDREKYFELCWPNADHTKNFEIIRMLPDGDRVITTYDGESDDGKVFRNTEIHTVKGGKITDIEVYFGWNLPHKAPLNSHLT